MQFRTKAYCAERRTLSEPEQFEKYAMARLPLLYSLIQMGIACLDLWICFGDAELL